MEWLKYKRIEPVAGVATRSDEAGKIIEELLQYP